MKSLKVKLVSVVSAFILALSLLIIGVWAVGEAQHINLSGSVNFTISNDTLYIKDIRIRDANDLTGQGSTIENFIPGFVNGDFDLDLGERTADTSFTLLFDVINTTTTEYKASTVSTIPNATLSVSGIIVGDGVAPSEITNRTPISGTIVMTVTVQSAGTVSLDGIVIDIEEWQGVEVIVQSSNSNLGIAEGTMASIGEEVVLTASFTGNAEADFLGWSTDLTTDNIFASLPEYKFILEENSPTTYYAIFEEANNDFTYSTTDAEEGEITLTKSITTETSIIIPSMVYREEQSCEVTVIDNVSMTRAPQPGGMGGVFAPNGDFVDANADLTSVVLPQTLRYIGDSSFYGSNITTINFGDCINLVEIGTKAFSACRGLTSINLSNCTSLTSIGDFAFHGCSGLTSITLPAGLTSIGSQAFYDCDNLTSVTFKNTEGWQVSRSSDMSGAISVDVSVPSTNATYFKSTYRDYYWQCNA